jgi:predicted Zn-dependent protease
MLVESSRPIEGVPSYRKAAQLAPNEPLIQIGLASALLSTEKAEDVAEAVRHLKTALKDEPDNAMGWYYLADAYSRNGDESMAALATAERYFALRRYDQAVEFARRAQPRLKENGRDWQRANDIISVSQSEMSNRRRR